VRLRRQYSIFRYLPGRHRAPDPGTLRRFLRGRPANFDLDTTGLSVYGQQQ